VHQDPPPRERGRACSGLLNWHVAFITNYGLRFLTQHPVKECTSFLSNLVSPVEDQEGPGNAVASVEHVLNDGFYSGNPKRLHACIHGSKRDVTYCLGIPRNGSPD